MTLGFWGSECSLNLVPVLSLNRRLGRTYQVRRQIQHDSLGRYINTVRAVVAVLYHVEHVVFEVSEQVATVVLTDGDGGDDDQLGAVEGCGLVDEDGIQDGKVTCRTCAGEHKVTEQVQTRQR